MPSPGAVPPEITSGQRLGIHGLLLLASLVIYAFFRAMWIARMMNPAVAPTLGGALAPFALLFALSAFAFGATAWIQPHWRSRDAARVACVVWFVASVFYFLVLGCPRVLLLIVIPFFPFCLGALIGHNVGRFHHPAHWDGIEMDRDS